MFLPNRGSTSTSIDNFLLRFYKQWDQTLLVWVSFYSVEKVLLKANGQTLEQDEKFNLIFESASFSMWHLILSLWNWKSVLAEATVLRTVEPAKNSPKNMNNMAYVEFLLKINILILFGTRQVYCQFQDLWKKFLDFFHAVPKRVIIILMIIIVTI